MYREMLDNLSIGAVVHFVLLAFTIPRILLIKKDATTAVAWIFGVLLVPYVGVVLFWTTGDPTMRRPLQRILEGPAIHVTRRRRPGKPKFPQLNRLFRALDETPETYGNDVWITTNGPELFRAIARDLRSARFEICVQYFIFRDDVIGRKIAAILRKKAREGVRVYFLYDAVGSRRLSREFLSSLRRAGIMVHAFLPMSILRRRFQINFRNHRKLVVVDRTVAYSGGFNVGKEYAGLARKGWSRNWFDVHFRVKGPAVEHLLEEFGADWAFSTTRKDEQMEAEPKWLADCRMETDCPPNEGWVQTVSSGPDQDENRIHSFMFYAFSRARRRIWIATPYFIPDQAIETALLVSARSGVEIRILIQNQNPDKKIPYFAAAHFAAPLIAAGVKFYLYNPGMMHAKMFIIDDDIASVGSANVDVRSLALNFELNGVFASKKERQAIEAIFEDAFSKSTLITPEAFAQRGLPQRLLENLCRLFAPIL